MLSRRTFGIGLAATVGVRSAFGNRVHTVPGMADAFVDSIGVNVHLFRDSPYLQDNRFERVLLPALVELGIRHVRDGLSEDRGFLGRIRRLHACGIRTNHIAEPQITRPAMVRALLDDAGLREGISMLEGINEPDGYWGSQTRWHDGLPTEQAVVKFQAALHGSVAGTGLPLATPALINLENVPLYAGLAPYAEYGNCHPYPGDHHPETRGWGDRGPHGPPDASYGSLEWARDNFAYVLTGGPKPFIASETGYTTTTSPVARLRHPGCSEAIAAKYEPRLFLHYFNAGVTRTFHYELFDEGTDPDNPEHHFGWVRHDGTRKAAFFAMRNLISALKDPGPVFDPGKLDISISGAPPEMEATILRKRRGEWIVALWLACSCWNAHASLPLAVAARPVTVSLPDDISRAALNRPGQDGRFTPVAIVNRSLRLDIGDEVTLLRLKS